MNKKNDNENKLKSYMDNSPFGMFVVDFEKGGFSDANKMAEEMSGYSYEELMEMSPKDLFSEDFFPFLDNHFNNVFSIGKDDVDLELIKKNTETMIVSITGVKLSETSVIGFVKDVTEERIAERELEHVSLMKNTLLDNTDQMFFLIDQNLRIIDYNKKAQVIAKKMFNTELYIGTPVQIFASENQEEFFAQSFMRAFKGEIVKGEIAVKSPDGSNIFVEINLNPVIDEETGKVWAISFTGYDITDLKKTENALRLSEERFRLAALSTSDIIYELDINTGQITWFGNDEKFTSLDIDPLPRTLEKWLDSVHLEDREKLYQFTRKEWSNRKPYSGEYRLLGNKGKIVYIEDYSVGVYDGNDKLIRVVGAITNISDRKYYEEQLKFLSYYDQLTEVNNRSFFEEKIKELEAKKNHPVSIIVVDLDGLKLINDTIGHYRGDVQLKTIASIIKQSLTGRCCVSRTGGDEFAVILPGGNDRDAEVILKNILSLIKEYNSKETDIPISISFGIATSQEGISLEEVFKRADDLMYRNKLSKGNSAKSQIIKSLMATLAERDYITEGHAGRLSDICVKIGKKMKLSYQMLNNLDLLSKVHDLGKVGIPDSILLKPSSLDAEEWEVMKLHPEKGFRIAISSPDLAGIADLILKHHERWDGDGYPIGLSGSDIPLECRILAVADTFDAMTNERPYSRPCSEEEALKEIIRCSGTQFDPEIVKVFLEIME